MIDFEREVREFMGEMREFKNEFLNAQAKTTRYRKAASGVAKRPTETFAAQK